MALRASFYCSILFVFFICLNSFAQIRMGLGPSVHYGSSSVSYTNLHSQRSTSATSFSSGVAFYFMNTKHLGLQVELNYASKSFNFSDSISFPDAPVIYGGSYKRYLSYIEIPLMSHFELGKNKFKLIINLGPQFSYLLYARQSYGTGALAAIEYRKDAILYEQAGNNKFQFGMVGGLGFSYLLPLGLIQLDGRYYQGLTNIIPAGSFTTFSLSDIGVNFSYIYILPSGEKVTVEQKP